MTGLGGSTVGYREGGRAFHGWRQRREAAAAAVITARKAAAAEEAAEEAKAAFGRSPLGRAMLAKTNRDGFFEIELLAGEPDQPMSGSSYPNRAFDDVLASIEKLGWRLEHVGYVPGTSVAGRRRTTGIYLFRNTDWPPPSMRRTASRSENG